MTSTTVSPLPSPSTKPTFWRIQNIKIDERNTVTAWLKDQVKQLTILKGQGSSLAADGEETLCATLTSHERPTSIKPGWIVDEDFIGYTPLSEPKNANVDIVAVTGLGGHALGSFRSADGMSAWLRDFAPEDLPRARFITYGYATDVVASDNNQGVHELSRTLLDGLAIFRQRTQTQQRPLLFICHSLGGIVVKEALVMASKANEPKHKGLLEIATATHGLVFMGVPNLGLKHNQLETIVKGRANEGFVRDLLVRSDGEPSQYLKGLTNEFSYLDRQRDSPFEIVSYYETVRSPTVENLGDGRFVTTGPRELMVTRASAERIGHHVRNIDHLSLSTDHRGLVRFEHSRDTKYVSVIEKLKGMASSASRCGYVRQLSKGSPDRAYGTETQAPARKEFEVWFEALRFPNMDRRQLELKQTKSTSGTGEWLFTHEEYKAWETNDSSNSSFSILVLQGKAGSGKSILMHKALARAVAMHQDSNSICLSYFFDAARDEVRSRQSSPEGLYRSILSQILANIDRSPDVLALVSKWGTVKEDVQETVDDVVKLKDKISCLLATIRGKTLRIFLDALDECGKGKDRETADTVELLGFIQDLQEHEAAVSILISTRDIAQFGSSLSVPAIEMSEHNGQDILKFLNINLKHWSDPNDPHGREKLIPALLRRSSNVFLWAKLVVDRINLKANSGLTSADLVQEVNHLPRELEGIYKILLTDLDPKDRSEALTLLQLLQVSLRPLNPLEIRSALEYARGTDALPTEFGLSEDAFEARVRRICRGFVEIQVSKVSVGLPNSYEIKRLRSDQDTSDLPEQLETNAGPDPEPKRLVQFTHDSVRDFLDTYGWGNLDIESSQHSTALRAHMKVTRLCMLAVGHAKEGTPFLFYASQFWTVHARNANQALDDHFQPPKFVTDCTYKTRGIISRYKKYSMDSHSLEFLQSRDIPNTRWLADDATMLMLLAFEGCGNLLTRHGDSCTHKRCCKEGSKLQDAFALALLRGWKVGVEAVCNIAKVQSIQLDPTITAHFTQGICPLQWICRHGQHEILKSIIGIGWDTSSTAAKASFCEGVIRGHGGIVKLFLDDAGDDALSFLSWQSPKGYTAFHFAASYGRWHIFDMLLGSIDDNNRLHDLMIVKANNGKSVLDVAQWCKERHGRERDGDQIVETIEYILDND